MQRFTEMSVLKSVETAMDSRGEYEIVIEIKRHVPYLARSRDLYADTREERRLAREDQLKRNGKYSLPQIYSVLKDNADIKMNPHLQHVKKCWIKTEAAIKIYNMINMCIDTIHERMPPVLVKSYLQMDTLFQEIQEILEKYDHPRHPDRIVEKVYELEDILLKSREIIEDFWLKRPEVALRLPSEILHRIFSPSVFARELYLPYTFGHSPLPEWTDPEIIYMINEARKTLGLDISSEIVCPKMLLSRSFKHTVGKENDMLIFTITVD